MSINKVEQIIVFLSADISMRIKQLKIGCLKIINSTFVLAVHTFSPLAVDESQMNLLTDGLIFFPDTLHQLSSWFTIHFTKDLI
ncbi:hypothetical protein DO97_16885 [Neosynechococcus sphagnicola sy1]|uniref:Uncharacterized protein n=1 Tax=Neosynechococcus sphagnicola sy1 TaxID=1497020 RepID=A0A098TMT5_9CYAN|nr:hypothetical protein DO97_16885 [Neosynechococcus sphagnicola sy1]